MNNNKFKILEVLDLAWGGKAIIMQAKDCELHIFFDYVIHNTRAYYKKFYLDNRGSVSYSYYIQNSQSFSQIEWKRFDLVKESFDNFQGLEDSLFKNLINILNSLCSLYHLYLFYQLKV